MVFIWKQQVFYLGSNQNDDLFLMQVSLCHQLHTMFAAEKLP